jgi:hypothetical protein
MEESQLSPEMSKITFYQRKIDKLHYERFHHRIQSAAKMEALLPKKSHEIRWKKLPRITEPTLLSYLRGYKEGGIGKLKELTFNRPQSELKQHQESLEIYFREHPQKTLAHSCSNNCRVDGNCP